MVLYDSASDRSETGPSPRSDAEYLLPPAVDAGGPATMEVGTTESSSAASCPTTLPREDPGGGGGGACSLRDPPPSVLRLEDDAMDDSPSAAAEADCCPVALDLDAMLPGTAEGM